MRTAFVATTCPQLVMGVVPAWASGTPLTSASVLTAASIVIRRSVICLPSLRMSSRLGFWHPCRPSAARHIAQNRPPDDEIDSVLRRIAASLLADMPRDAAPAV